MIAIAKGIDDKEPEKDEYVRYAEAFRMPYWDWARKGDSVFPPQALDNSYKPEGKPSSAARPEKYNPLFLFPFPQNTHSDITVSHINKLLPAHLSIKLDSQQFAGVTDARVVGL